MPFFRCTVVTSGGRRTSLVKEAADEMELASSFNDTDQILVKYHVTTEAAVAGAKKNYSRDVILEFTEIMTSLLNAGLTVQDSVSLCASIAQDSKTALLCGSILRALQSGLPFHKALEMHQPSFSSLFKSLVKLGEQTGSVAAVFGRMSLYLRNEKKIRGKIGSVIWYPSLVLSAAVAGSVAVIAFVMPKMAEIYSAFRSGADDGTAAELSGMYNSVWVSACVFILTAVSVVGTVILRKYSNRFTYLTDLLFLKIPVFGGFIKSIQTMDFSFAMEMLTGCGINVHNALRETAAIIRNRAYGRAVAEVHALLLKGENLSGAFASFKEFPPYVATWVAVGERTGAAGSVFAQIRGYFQEDVERMSEKLMNLLEPCLILVAGIIVLVLVLQFLLPLFSLYGRLL